VVPERGHPREIDERPSQGEVRRITPRAWPDEKAAGVAAVRAGALIISADTVVAAGRRILPKAETEAKRAPAELLSGRRHRVLSAVTVIDAEGRARRRLSNTIVAFKRFDRAELDAYLASDEWRGKAGGYAIQGSAEALVRMISGSHSGVVGLPLYETRALLRAAGYPPALFHSEKGPSDNA
jgi:septum formation protein